MCGDIRSYDIYVCVLLCFCFTLYICVFQLGLPSSCVVTVPLYKNTHKMDLTVLVRLVEEDTAASKTPIMVVAYAGTVVVYMAVIKQRT